MALSFLDSSAIVKRYFQEPGHEWIERLHDPDQGHGLYIAAGDLCRSHRLRAYDAIQLACALAVHQDILVAQPPDGNPPDFFFVSADNGLLAVAGAVGFKSENPNTYV